MDGAAYAVARPNREDSKDTQSIRWRANLSLLKLEEEISIPSNKLSKILDRGLPSNYPCRPISGRSAFIKILQIN